MEKTLTVCILTLLTYHENFIHPGDDFTWSNVNRLAVTGCNEQNLRADDNDLQM